MATSRRTLTSLTPPAKFRPKARTNKTQSTVAVCKFYNSYFETGCQSGRYCEFQHLKERDFLMFCRHLQKRDQMDISSKKMFGKAKNYFNQNRIKKSFDIFKKLTQNYPFNASHNIWLARCHEKLQNIESARFYYRKAISIDPFNATYHGRYACFAYKKLNSKYHISEAKHHFQKSLKLKNTLSVVHRDYGHYLQCIDKDWNAAQYHYKQCLHIFPKDDECHYFYAKLLHLIGGSSNATNETEKKYFAQSESHFLKCIRFQQERTGYNFFKYHFDYALLLKSMKRYKECKKQFVIALNLNDKWFRVHLEYGLLLCSKHFNDFTQGLHFIENAIAIKPHSRKLQNLYQSIKNTKQCENSSDYYAFTDSSDGGSGSGDGSVALELEEKQEIARKCRQSEFSRFLLDRVELDEEYLDLYFQKSQEMKLNDIRVINMVEPKVLIKEIVGLNNLNHFEMFQNTICKFKRDSHEFMEWLKSMKLTSEYYDLFEKYGILTFESFDHHLKSENDLLWLIGDKNKTDATCVWNNVQKQTKIMVNCQ